MKAVVIVDGLNLYHALKALGKQTTNLDIRKASIRILSRDLHELEVFYFTSPPEHLGGEAMRNYAANLSRLKETGVVTIEGRFQRTGMRCKICGTLTQINKEKETDVSIALKIVETAYRENVEKIILFSADSDLAPALRLAKSINHKVQITVVQTGPYLRNSHPALMAHADSKVELKPKFIHSHQFGLDKAIRS